MIARRLARWRRDLSVGLRALRHPVRATGAWIRMSRRFLGDGFVVVTEHQGGAFTVRTNRERDLPRSEAEVVARTAVLPDGEVINRFDPNWMQRGAAVETHVAAVHALLLELARGPTTLAGLRALQPVWEVGSIVVFAHGLYHGRTWVWAGALVALGLPALARLGVRRWLSRALDPE